jgi:FkbM family methyltransferase
MSWLKRAVNPWGITQLSLGFPKSETISISFKSGKARFHALVPPNSFWTAVKDVLIHEAYESADGFRLSELSRDSVVIDAGSFVGLFSLKASPFAGKVVALEPNLSNYSILRSNLESNSVLNVDARNAALWSTRDGVNFLHDGTSSRVTEGGSTKVASTTLEQLTNEFARIDLLKMDIEGSEYDVLLGTDCQTLQKIKRIVLELHEETPYEKERKPLLLKHLKDCWPKVEFLEPRYRFARPWKCSLTSMLLGFRAWLSLAYLIERVHSMRYEFDTGRTDMVYASR